MKKHVFTKVETALHPVLGTQEGHAQSRFMTLCGILTGLVLRQKVDMDSIGQGFVQHIKPDSRRVRCKRFFENKHINYETFYYPYICVILQQLFSTSNSEKLLLLTIDGTSTGSQHATLAISFLFKGISYPFCWITRKGSKGHFSEQQHIELIEKSASLLQLILPLDWSVALLGDGEFDGADVQILCKKTLGWGYVLRTNCNTLLYENGDVFQPQQLEVPNMDYLFIEGVAFGKQQKLTTNFILWHQQNLYEHPIPLVSTFEEPMMSTTLYRKRYSIERLFKGVKSSGFNVHKTRLTKATSIDRLLMAVFLAYILMINFAQAHQDHPIKAMVVRIRKEEVLSPIVLALRIVAYCLENCITFILSLKISKNFVEFQNTG
jgi:hypothetical protein